MDENKKDNKKNMQGKNENGKNDKVITEQNKKNHTVFAKKQINKRNKAFGRRKKSRDEFEQKIIDIARVTRVMAGGKRMRFRACIGLGDRRGSVAVGVAKGADVTLAVAKAVNVAKKKFVKVPMVNETIPHEIYYKLGAAKVLLKPASRGRGIIAGGAARIILELSGIKNITGKILGTNNKLNIAKCTVEALDNLKKIEQKNKGKQEKNNNKKNNYKKEDKK